MKPADPPVARQKTIPIPLPKATHSEEEESGLMFVDPEEEKKA
jgi:hypothetical protein